MQMNFFLCDIRARAKKMDWFVKNLSKMTEGISFYNFDTTYS